MAKYMVRKKSLFEIPECVKPRLPDIEPRPLKMEDVKKQYPNI